MVSEMDKTLTPKSSLDYFAIISSQIEQRLNILYAQGGDKIKRDLKGLSNPNTPQGVDDRIELWFQYSSFSEVDREALDELLDVAESDLDTAERRIEFYEGLMGQDEGENNLRG